MVPCPNVKYYAALPLSENNYVFAEEKLCRMNTIAQYSKVVMPHFQMQIYLLILTVKGIMCIYESVLRNTGIWKPYSLK